jgi:hypothetical protein
MDLLIKDSVSRQFLVLKDGTIKRMIGAAVGYLITHSILHSQQEGKKTQ